MARRLDRDEAFALAVDWGRRLARVADVELEANTTQHAPAHLRVRFEVGNGDLVTTPMTRDAWSVLRETLAVWRALACCRGVSSNSESRAFWNRVAQELVLELAVDDDTCLQLQQRDAAEPSASASFRLTLCVSITALDDEHAPANVRTLLGGFVDFAVSCSRDARKAERAAAFRAAWRRLKPFVDETQPVLMRSIDMVLQLEAYRYDPCTVFMHELPSVLAIITDVVPARGTKRIKYTHLRLQELQFKDWRVASNAQLLDLTSLLSVLPVRLSKLSLCVETLGCQDPYSQFVREALGLEQLTSSSTLSRWRPPTHMKSSPSPLVRLSLVYEQLDAQRFVALFSALPHTRCLETLQLGSENADTLFPFSSLLVSWIGYAVFHPKTRSSRWRKLALQYWRSDGSEPHNELTQMLVNPLALLSVSRLAALVDIVQQDEQRQGSCANGMQSGSDGDERDVDCKTLPFTPSKFQLAFVRGGAAVREFRSIDADAWITLQCDVQLEMCEAGQRDDTTERDANAFVRVLVPGFGFGWVLVRDVSSVTDWAIELPLMSPLTAFECDCVLPEMTTLLLLRAIGANLFSLCAVLDPLDPHLLDVVAHACPDLQHIGALPTSARGQIALDSLTRLFSRHSSQLQSLALGWDIDTIMPLMALLGQRVPSTHTIAKLKNLHICMIDHGDELCAATDAIERMLRVNKHLEQLVLATSFDGSMLEADVAQQEARLRAFDGEDLTCYSRLRQRLAFLSAVSVVSHAVPQYTHSGCRRLDAALIAAIFAFAIPNLRRQVTIFRQPMLL